MFTGIIEGTAKVLKMNKLTADSTSVVYEIQKLFTDTHIDQSISHSGVCLTVSALYNESYEVVAVAETLQKTNLSELQVGHLVNIERCMAANGRFDGHIVQGHVDAVGQVLNVVDVNGSWLITFSFPAQFETLIVEKGSICINGTSLTCFNVKDSTFAVTIIPYTWEHTNFHALQAGQMVNLEFDIVGKYVQKMLASRHLV